ncbi:hypothetical protein A7982_12182 [Minicystis rosea]|nr:hypothetical protein A7982_12182 [Minicystis rosea]
MNTGPPSLPVRPVPPVADDVLDDVGIAPPLPEVPLLPPPHAAEVSHAIDPIIQGALFMRSSP